MIDIKKIRVGDLVTLFSLVVEEVDHMNGYVAVTVGKNKVYTPIELVDEFFRTKFVVGDTVYLEPHIGPYNIMHVTDDEWVTVRSIDRPSERPRVQNMTELYQSPAYL